MTKPDDHTPQQEGRPPVSDRIITQDLMARLQRHYIKPSQGFTGGVFVPECGLNGQTSRRCDALYVGFTSTSGRMLVGHEVKASRSDWLHELDQLDKADLWADQCHEWWLVTAPGVVHDGELPAGWGHLEPGPSRTRMKVVVRAARHGDRQPSWLIVRSLIARLDTLQVQAAAQHRVDVREELRAEHQQALQALRERTATIDPEDRQRLEVLAKVEQHLGVQLSGYGYERVRADEFAQALEVVRARTELAQRWGGLGETAQELRQQADRMDRMAKALTPTAAQDLAS